MRLTCIKPGCQVPFHYIRLDLIQYTRRAEHGRTPPLTNMTFQIWHWLQGRPEIEPCDPMTALNALTWQWSSQQGWGNLWPTFNERTGEGGDVVAKCVNEIYTGLMYRPRHVMATQIYKRSLVTIVIAFLVSCKNIPSAIFRKEEPRAHRQYGRYSDWFMEALSSRWHIHCSSGSWWRKVQPPISGGIETPICQSGTISGSYSNTVRKWG